MNCKNIKEQRTQAFRALKIKIVVKHANKQKKRLKTALLKDKECYSFLSQFQSR